MKAITTAFGFVAVTAGALGGSFLLPTMSAQAIPVFDISNYAQNVLQAARALEQINNQVRSLQNEAAMLQNMARNLQKIDFPQLARMTSAMQRIDKLMGEARGIDFSLDRLDEQVRALFPGELDHALTRDERVASARARLDAATSAYRQAMGVQAQVAENGREDAGVLNELASSSQNAVGALQVSQAANQLLALSVKPQLQLQNLMVSEFRDQAIERARRAQSEADGKAMTRRFLGSGGVGPARN